jgi:DNA polymerase (family X)
MKKKQLGWSLTVLFSNTARAHRQEKNRDWVVIYYERGGREDQCTVVTARSGKLKGKRVIRGRENECISFYREKGAREK